MNVSVVIPAFNEADVIGGVVSELKEKYPEYEILLIDDGSEDSTAEIASSKGAKVIQHAVNQGYGSSWKSGVTHAKEDVLVFFDGDGQMQVDDIARLIDEMRNSGADMVSGARSSGQGSPFLRRPGKVLLRWLGQFMINKPIQDLNCGLRAIKKDILKKYVHLLPNGFSASTTSLMVFMQRGYLVRFIPINVIKRSGSKSTVKFFSDGFGTILLMIRLIALFNPLRFFLPVSMCMLVIAIAYSLFEVVSKGLGVPVLGAVSFIGGLQIFTVGIVCDQVSALRLERFESASSSGTEYLWKEKEKEKENE